MLVWRHGRTSWNLADRYQGQVDIELDAVGIAQAERAAEALATLQPAAILSSDLRRAADTAAALGRRTGLRPVLDKALRETYAGDWQGLTMAEIAQRDPVDFQAWRAGQPVRRGGGELETEVAERALAAITPAVDRLAPGGLLVVATHGGCARVTLGAMLGLQPSDWRLVGGLANCYWSVLEQTGAGWRLTQHNVGSLASEVLGEER